MSQGCLSSTVVMRVKADGSGTAVMTLRVNRQAMEEFTRALSDVGRRLGAGEAPNQKPWRLEDALPEPPIGVSGSVQMLTPAVEGATEADSAWTPDGALLMAKGDRVYSWRRGQSGWREVSGSERLGLRSVTRMAVRPDGKWLAIVASPQ
jgi:hypothetical protein